MYGLLFLVLALIFFLKVNSSPDFLLDEVYYTQLSQHILNVNEISVSGGPFFVHPPLFFVVGGIWTFITGTSNSNMLDGLHAIRYLDALFCIGTGLLTAALVRAATWRTSPAIRVWGMVGVTLLVGLNGFMLSFGRTVLIEPAAVFMAALVIYVAYRMRNSATSRQIIVLGVLIGLACLVKQTVAFASVAPFLAAIIRRDGKRMAITGSAVVLGAVVWAAFPVWAAINGTWSGFWNQQHTSLQRLVGIVHTTGLSLSSASPTTQFTKTFLLYSSGYLLFIIGAVGLLLLLLLPGFVQRIREFEPISESAALIFSYGFVSYIFFVYSVLIGAGNQQLAIYAAAPSALLSMYVVGRLATRRVLLPRDENPAVPPFAASDTAVIPSRRASGDRTPFTIGAAALSAVMVLVGAIVWLSYYAVGSDNGTVRMAAWIDKNVHACVTINSTGARTRWQDVLDVNPVSQFRDGPTALRNNVHLFLLSPKDARYSYGNMSKSLATWIQQNGTLVNTEQSRSSESLSLYRVGAIPATTQTTGCIPNYPGPSTNASATGFVLALLVDLLIVIGLGRWVGRLIERRNSASPTPPTPPTPAEYDPHVPVG